MQSTQRPEPSQPKGISKPPAATCDAGILELAKLAITDLLAKFRHEDAAHVLRWIPTLTDHNAPVVWVTFHQLLVDFQLLRGKNGSPSKMTQLTATRSKWRGFVGFFKGLGV